MEQIEFWPSKFFQTVFRKVPTVVAVFDKGQNSLSTPPGNILLHL